ncbi:MAG TPA: toll/interleukin-1 receptor domain-containing protein, partial [Planctomycetota bacterium]|nr:toll/interleukin-1 receptor domain-containing protein [Planctomycetota bacterium]
MLNLFFAYSHADEKLRDQLEVHLKMLQRQDVIRTWHDREIGAGLDIDEAISDQLATADLVLLLVSPHFLASDYCYKTEMQRALTRHRAGEARVIPVILEPSDWQGAPFGKLRATPPDGKPIATFTNLNEGFLAVARDIRKAAKDMAARRQRVL